MTYQNIKNLLGNTPNHPCEFRINNWVEINDVCEMYNPIV